MDELSMKFNKLMMEEMGLEVGPRQRLYDQDTGMLVQFDGKDLVAPGSASGREAQEFDPYNSTRMMAQMFSYFTDKLVESGEADEYDVIYNVDNGNGKGHIEMKNDNNILISKDYQRDQCKYADLVLRLNGDDDPDLAEFDISKAKQTNIKKKTINKTMPRSKVRNV